MKKVSLSSIRRFSTRLIVAFFVVSGFFIVTQDFQVFPTLIPSVLGMKTGEPEGWVTRTFVETADSKSIDVWRVRPEGEAKSVAILFRGNGEPLFSLMRFQKFLADNGITSYSFDYRGSGRSSGWPSEEGIYLDSAAVAAHVLQEEKISPKQLTLVGFSIGTGPASHLAKELQTAKLILVSPYFDLPSLVGELPLMGYLVSFLRYNFPNGENVKQLKKTAVTIFHGTTDTVVPIHHSERIVAGLAELSAPRYVKLEGIGHNDILPKIADEIVSILLR